MDPHLALTGTSQISVHCTECNCTLTKWINQMKNVDNSITYFREDLLALQLTYDRLAGSMKDGAMVQVARTADNYAGGHLWSHISTILNDCQTAILGIRQTLQSIEFGSRRISSIVRNLADALNGGDLFVVKESVKLLDQSIAFPLSMIKITMQLQHSSLTEAAPNLILQELTNLKAEHDGFRSKVQKLLPDSHTVDSKVFRHMQDFSDTLNTFLLNTASSLSRKSTAHAHDTLLIPAYPGGSQAAVPQSQSDAEAVGTASTKIYEELDAAISISQSNSLPGQDENSNIESDTEADNEIELELTLEYMANGQADLEANDFAGAEENFRAALEMAQENDFSKWLEYGPGDITLMLADCLLKQGKEEEALEILEPLADGSTGVVKADNISQVGSINSEPGHGLQYQASHILGLVFLKRNDFQAAEKRAKEAFKGRRRLLGPSHGMTLESVQLIIDIYTAKNDKINARAYRRFLEPTTKSHRHSTASVGGQGAIGAPSPGRNVSLNASRPHVGSPGGLAVNINDSQSTALLSMSATVSQVGNSVPPPLQARRTAHPTSPDAMSLPSDIFRVVDETTQQVSQGCPQIPSAKIHAPLHASSQPWSASVTNSLSSPKTVLPQISENEPTPASPSSAGTKLAVTSAKASPPKIEPDPLPPNISPATTTTKKKKSWSNPFSKSSKADTNSPKKTERGSSDTSFHDDSRNSVITAINMVDAKRHMSLAGSFSFESRSSFSKVNDYGAEKEPRRSISSKPYSMSTHPPSRTRQELEPKFAAIKSLRAEGKKGVAVESAMKLLKEYDPDRKVLMIREAEIKKNMRESHKGMAGTGHGYAPIHFFCEHKIEASIEVELLIEQGVDVNAVAYKAGMPGTDPFTSLQRAVELGHVEIVRLLIDADVSLEPPKLPKTTSTIAGKEQITQPLLIACTKGHTEITYALLAAGAGKILKDFPQRLWHGNSLLHEACWNANTEMVKMLLDYSKALKQAQRQSGSCQPDYESGVIGSPGQQDQFGATPIMYAIDLRDCISDKMRTMKTEKRKDCLRMLLEDDVHGDLHSQTYRESVARTLSLKWAKGPGQGHSIFCYADEAGDDELSRLLDPFRYQVSPGMRCSASPPCSATLRSSVLSSGSTHIDGPGRNVRLPSFPELMSTPVETHKDQETPPPSFENAGGSISSRSPTFDDGRAFSMNLTRVSGSMVGSDR